ncbi:MAG TPA: M28 family peptidase [Vicinamibacterales bacterium]|nr:M28 family peptidase [Vicinamibacterales bacterium]
MRTALGRGVAIVFLCVPLAAQHASQHEAIRHAPQNESIRQEDLHADLFFVAGDSMRGRLTDTEENRATADFIRSRFERMGLKGAATSGSYFQTYNLMTATLAGDRAANALEIAAADGTRRLRAGQEFYPHRFSASGVASAPVVFVGFGISAPPLAYDDYRGDLVRGKIVLALDHEPGERDPNSSFDGVVTSEWSTPWRKALAAQEAGAAAVLFVSDVHNHPGAANFEAAARNYWPEQPPRIPSYTLTTWADRIRIPVAQISPALAATLVNVKGRTFEELARGAEGGRGGPPVPLGPAKVTIRTAVDRHVVPDRNVVAMLEGSDPRLKNEWVIVSAHFDHNGADATQIFNGADDNGSGTVALIEIAEAYALAAKEGHLPKRSVLFAAWNSEERGLLGAWAFTEQPLVPLQSIAAVLNMDMIGRNEEIPIGGGGRFAGFEVQTAESNNNAVNLMAFSKVPDITSDVERANANGIGLDLKKRYDNNSSNLVRRSDQWPFLQRGVPAMGFMTGLHPDYHTQYDRPEKINYVKMEKIARLVHQVSWDLANADARPKAPASRTQ